MVEFRLVPQQPLQRQTVTGRTGQVGPAPLVPAGATAQVGQATAALGQVLGHAGIAFLEAAQARATERARLQKIQDNTAQGTALAGSILGLEDARRQVLNDPSIRPDQRTEAIAFRVTDTLQAQARALPESVRGSFLRTMAGRLADVMRTEGDKGAQEVVEERQRLAKVRLEGIHRESVTTTDPIRHRKLQLERQEVVAGLIEDGSITEGEGQLMLLGEEDADASARLNLAIRQDPEPMVARLEDPTFLPALDPEERIALLDVATREASRRQQERDRTTQRVEVQYGKQRSATEGRLSVAIDNANIGELDRLDTEMDNLVRRADGTGLTVAAWRRLEGDVDTKRELLTKPRPIVSDPVLRQEFEVEVMRDRGARSPFALAQLRNRIYDAVKKQLLNYGDVAKPLLDALAEESRQDTPIRDDTIQTIRKRLFFELDERANKDAQFNEASKARMVGGLQAFDVAVEQAWARQGIDAARAVAAVQRTQVRNAYTLETFREAREQLGLRPDSIIPLRFFDPAVFESFTTGTERDTYVAEQRSLLRRAANTGRLSKALALGYSQNIANYSELFTAFLNAQERQ